jgi:hypothetical protein
VTQRWPVDEDKLQVARDMVKLFMHIRAVLDRLG